MGFWVLFYFFGFKKYKFDKYNNFIEEGVLLGIYVWVWVWVWVYINKII